MVAVTIGVIDKIVLMFLVGGVEYCTFPHVCSDALLLIAAELACVNPLLGNSYKKKELILLNETRRDKIQKPNNSESFTTFYPLKQT